MATRNPELRVAGGFMVFPGGALDEADQQLADQQDGSDELLPFRIAAARELTEEVGVELSPLALNDMVYFSRWITPATMAARFDTLFFVAEAPADQQAVADGSELISVEWMRPADVVKAAEQGELIMMMPTVACARLLMPYDTVSELLDALRGREVSPIQPEASFAEGKVTVQVPESAGLGMTSWTFPNPVKRR